MTVRGVERIRKLYPRWFLYSVIVLIIILYLQIQYQLRYLLFCIVLALLGKDIFIDILAKRGPTPSRFEHAPFVILVSFVGLLGIGGIEPFQSALSPLTPLLAIIDTVIDVADDLGLIRG